MRKPITYKRLAKALIEAVDIMWELNGNISEDKNASRLIDMAEKLKPYLNPVEEEEPLPSRRLSHLRGEMGLSQPINMLVSINKGVIL
jgi:hypothetical protein